ncbi:VWA domain-containing protein [Candidatus Berkiella cookevillensis]|uniref:Calx-beta domain protein n=1 Tax=Candidatus Berkiella cookevillensis TaxID=437022 RepID=A0A0Q9YQZ3_9GAMM|nr:DUF5801 repeats-in-toxin domain-containing protein [Candidatus Berkiella cookevillensis]MCS5708169.1 VWA domain-containing protein [Candidatus Berkiella cookevillensis]
MSDSIKQEDQDNNNTDDTKSLFQRIKEMIPTLSKEADAAASQADIAEKKAVDPSAVLNQEKPQEEITQDGTTNIAAPKIEASENVPQVNSEAATDETTALEDDSKKEDEQDDGELSLEDIQNLDASAAGASGGGAGGGFTIPELIGIGNSADVNSVARNLDISTPGIAQDEEFIPPLIARRINRFPSAVDDSVDSQGEALVFFEKSLSDGSAPGSKPLMLSGNILANDDLGDAPIAITDLSIPGFQTDKSNPSVWVIETNAGKLTVYVEDFNGFNQGDFSYELFDNDMHTPGNGENLIIETFSYTFQDSDGDQASANIIVTIVDDVPSIEIVATQTPDIIVDESDFNIDAKASFSVLFNVIPGADGIASLTYDLSILAPGIDSGLIDTLTQEAIKLSLEGGEVVGRTETSNLEVFRISIDPNTAEITLNQSRSIVHPDSTDPDEALSPASFAAENLISLNVHVVDNDGDSDNQSINIGHAFQFKDDGPSIELNDVSMPMLQVDDSDFSQDAVASFAGIFSINFGADGPKDIDNDDIADIDAVQYTLSISAEGTNSGLVDTLSNENIMLYLELGEVVGRTENGNLEVFRISVDPQSGEITLNQSRSVVHDNPNDPDEANEPATLSSSDLITLTLTVIDGDGDSTDESIYIGQAFSFKDDGPSISLTNVDIPVLTVDESDFTANASASFAGLFSALFGNDGPKDSNNDDVADVDAVTYALNISAQDANSGLVDSLSNEAVKLFLEGNDVVGRTEVGNIEVFRVSVDANSGVVTLEQSRAVVHDNPNDPDEADSPAMLLAADLIKLIATVTDGDGDTASAVADIGQAFRFEDDGPSINRNEIPVPSLVVDESNFAIDASSSFAILFSGQFGADGPKDSDNNDIQDNDAITYILSVSTQGADTGLVDTLSNENVKLFLEGNEVIGRTEIGNIEVFRVSVDANSGVVTLDQSRAVVHDNPNDPDEADSPAMLSAADLIKLTATITDADGDTASAVADIGQAFKFKDDGPSIDLGLAAVPLDLLTVDESNLAVNASANFADNFSIVSSSYGADGAGSQSSSYALSITASGVDSGLSDVATGQNILLFMNNGVVEGRVGGVNGPVAFSVSVDASGIVTLDQVRALNHPNAANPDDAITLANTNLVQLTRTDTIVDKDGDAASDSATLNIGQAFVFKDDGPRIDIALAAVAVDTLTVDESNLAVNASADFSDNFSIVTSDYGADGAGSQSSSYALSVSGSGVDSGLDDVATGQNILLFMNNGVVEGRVGNVNGPVAFSVSVDGSGVVTLDQIRALKHPDVNNHDDSITLSNQNAIQLTRTDTIIDKDGDAASDSATLNIGQAFVFKDDGPHANNDYYSVEPPTQPSYNLTFVLDVSGSMNTVIPNSGGKTRLDILKESLTGQNALLDSYDAASAALRITIVTFSGDTDGQDSDDATTSIEFSSVQAAKDYIDALSANGWTNYRAATQAASADIIQDSQDPNLDHFVDRLYFISDGRPEPAGTQGIDNRLTDAEELAWRNLLNENNVEAYILNIGSINQSDIDNHLKDLDDDQPGTVITVAANLSNLQELLIGTINQTETTGNVLTNDLSGADGGLEVINIYFELASPQAANNYINAHPELAGATANGNIVTIPVPNESITTPIGNVLHINSDGSFTYTSYHNENSGADDILHYTVKDKDGDTSSAELRFDIDGDVTILNLTPKTEGGDVSVDEDDLLANRGVGESAGSDPVKESNVVQGSFTILAPDGIDILSIGGHAIITNGVFSPTSFTTPFGNTFSVTNFNSATGEVTYSYTLNDNENHPSGNGENDLFEDLTVILKDIDGDTANNILSIRIIDDVPSVTVTAIAAADILTVDESNLSTNASANFSDNFSSVAEPGADGLASFSTSYTLSVSASGVDSGLDDVATGQNILLFMNNGVVEGRVGNVNGPVAFSVSVDGSGIVSLDQIRALNHPNAANPDDAVTLTNANLVRLTRTDSMTDNDGDTTNGAATINIGNALFFKDDGPNIDLGLAAVAVDILTVDESNLAVNASANFADNFSIVSSSYGADGAGSQSSSYALSVSASGVDSGLDDVATGQNVLLFMNNGMVEGRVGNVNGAVAFSVSVNGSGIVTLDQIRAMAHPNAANPDDAITLANTNLVQLTRTDTIVDKDGDTASDSATLNIGQAFVFKDDGSRIDIALAAVAVDILTVDESNLAVNASANFADNFTIVSSNYGADGAGSQSSSYALSVSASGVDSGLDDVATGQNILLFMNNGVVEGRVGNVNGPVAFSVSVNGSGIVTLDQIRAMAHPNAANPDDAITLANTNLVQLTRTDTIVDKDGDAASDSATLNIGQAFVFKDDGPRIDIALAAVAVDILTVDESNLGVNASANFADNFTIVSSNYGADGAGSQSSSYALSVSVSGVDSGLDDVATGQNILLFMNNGMVEGRVGNVNGPVAFSVSVNGSGVVTLDQIRALKHPDVNNHDDSITLSNQNAIQLTRTDTIVDKDGDSASDSATLNIGQAFVFKDDGPHANDDSYFVADPGLPSYNLTFVLDVSGSMNTVIPNSGGKTRLDILKESLTNNGALLDSYADASAALKITIVTFSGDADGQDSDDAATSIEFNSVQAAKDYIDSLSANGWTNYRAATQAASADIIQDSQNPNLDHFIDRLYFISDGKPEPAGTQGIDNRLTDAEELAWRNLLDQHDVEAYILNIGSINQSDIDEHLKDLDDDQPGTVITVAANLSNLQELLIGTINQVETTGNVLTNDLSGADGGLQVINIYFELASPQAANSYINAHPELAGATVNGNIVTIPVPNQSITTPIGNVLHMNSDGSFTYISNHNENSGADDVLHYTVKDKDGDTSSAVLHFDIDSNVTISNLTPKSEGGDVSVDEDDLLASRGVGESAGSDPVKESNVAQGSFTITAQDGINTLSIGGHAIITNGVFSPISFTTPFGNTFNAISFNNTTGEVTYSYTLNDNENHPAGNGENHLFEDLNITVSDTDGDTANNILSIRIVDDIPNIDRNQIDAPILMVDESNFAVDASASFANLFTGIFGADGAKDSDNNGIQDPNAITYSLGISANGANSGLVDSQSKEAINLFVVNNEVIGRTATSHLEVFKVSVDANSGLVTLNQSRAVMHSNPNDHDEASSPATLSSDNLITLTAVIVDGDGDTDSAVANIGGTFQFRDDGPTAVSDSFVLEVPPLPSYNLTFTIDISGSMGQIISGTGKSRLTLVKEALTSQGALLDSYAQASEQLRISIVTFAGDSDAQDNDDVWISSEFNNIAAAKAYINALTANGNTNYRAALQQTSKDIVNDANDPNLAHFIDKVYWLSDGQPVPSSKILTAQEELAWRNLLQQNNVDAIILNIAPAGSQQNVNQHLQGLANPTDSPAVIEVKPNLSNLQQLLLDTIDPVQTEGNLLTNDAAGADGPATVVEIKFTLGSNQAAQTYLNQHPELAGATRDGSTVIIPIPNQAIETPLGGMLLVLANGNFTYSGANGSIDMGIDSFQYTIKDQDGDKSTATFILHVAEQGTPFVSVNDASATEGTHSTIQFLVTLSHPADENITVNYQVTPDTAKNASDYLNNISNGSVTILKGSTMATLVLNVVDDSVSESTENFFITLTSAYKASGDVVDIDDSTGTGTIFDNDTNGLMSLKVDTNAGLEANDDQQWVEINSQIQGNLMLNDVFDHKATVISEVSFNTADADQFIIKHNLLSLDAYVDKDGETVHIPLPKDGSNIEIETPHDALLTINNQGEYSYSVGAHSVDETEHFEYTLLNTHTAESVSANFDVNVLSHPGSLVNLMGTTGDDVLTTAKVNAQAIIMNGGDGIDEFIVDVSETNNPEVIVVRDLGINMSRLTFINVEDSNHDGTASFADVVSSFTQDGDNVEVSLSNNTTLILEGIGVVNGHDVAALENHLNNITLEMNIVS